jgi:hypothetical protein
MEVPEGYKLVLINKANLKESQKKYYEANREKINEQRKKHYKERYHSDEAFRKRERERNKKPKKNQE